MTTRNRDGENVTIYTPAEFRARYGSLDLDAVAIALGADAYDMSSGNVGVSIRTRGDHRIEVAYTW